MADRLQVSQLVTQVEYTSTPGFNVSQLVVQVEYLTESFVVYNSVHLHYADNITLFNPVDSSLTVANATHLHSADNAAITTSIGAIASNATHLHTADNIVLFVPSITPTVNDSEHLHFADNIILIQFHNLQNLDSVHNHLADCVYLTGVLETVITHDSVHTHLADVPDVEFIIDESLNLLEFRLLFRRLSGRYDLVNEDGSDNGVDFFINEGSKYLDRINETQKSWASYFKVIQPGEFSTSIPYCRAVKEVWATTSIGRWKLEKKPLQEIMKGYLIPLRNSGKPLFYSPFFTRRLPEDILISGIEAFNTREYNAIILNIPTDEQLMLDIRGLFYSKHLTENVDENYWMISHPMLLYMSTMRQIEITQRNTQGVNDWDNAIRVEMQQLEFDLIDEQIADVNQMEG
jgi:hypothetical protein